MIELRKDYILDRWAILAQSRKKRPKDFIKQASESSGTCAFCRGNEKLTPKESGRISGKGGNWSMRWFPNLFPAAEVDGQKEVRTDNTFYTFAASYGSHEIVVETPEHTRQLWDFGPGEVLQLLKVYLGRIAELSRMDAVKYVAVFKNHGAEGGASLAHSHSQVTSINILPPQIREEATAIRNYSSCPYCSILGTEKNSYRRCFENSHAVAFTPYASRFNFEIWIFPKRHFRQLSDATADELEGISQLLQQVLARLKALNSPYNFVLHYLPATEPGDFHFHIEFQPRLSTWAGFEFNTGIVINSVTPEDAARFYRGEE